MATSRFSSVNVHDIGVRPIVAAAEKSADETCSWLSLVFGGEPLDAEIAIFMPFSRAERIALAINDAEARPEPIAAAAE